MGAVAEGAASNFSFFFKPSSSSFPVVVAAAGMPLDWRQRIRTGSPPWGQQDAAGTGTRLCAGSVIWG